MQTTGYRLRCYLIGLLVVGYIAGFSEGPKLGRPEFYPFFSWSLFSFTHSTRNDVVVLVDSVNGEKLDKAVSYYNLPEGLTRFPGGKIRMRKMLFDIHGANVAGQTERQTSMLEKYENIYFQNMGSVKYKLAIIEFNPIDRLKTGEYKVSRVVYEGAYNGK